MPQAGRQRSDALHLEEEVRGDVGPSELRRLRQLEEENAKLKRLVADLSLDKAMLQDVLSKNLKPSRNRTLIDELRDRYQRTK